MSLTATTQEDLAAAMLLDRLRFFGPQKFRDVHRQGIRPVDLIKAPDLLTVGNGTIDLQSGKLRPASAGHHITKATNVRYDPNARAPRWLKFLAEVFDAEAPFTPRGCIAQAWSVAEVLRCWVETMERGQV